ncbi:MAG: tetratricopeptide repeat protein [Bdellovibrionales bacterium]
MAVISSSSSSAPEAVKDVTLATFKAEVLDASKKMLVFVLFWTPRDNLCRQQAEALEKIVRSGMGNLKLARVDIDRDQSIARQMGVSSAPSVFAFYQGRPVDAFSGAMPEPQIKTWVAQLMKTTGVGGAETAGLDTAFQQAEEFLAGGDVATARSIYADIFAENPESAKAYAGLTRCFFDEGEVQKAREMLDAAPAAIAKDKALDSVRAAVELAEAAGKNKGQAEQLEAAVARNPDDHQARFDLAMAYYAAGRNEQAVDHLLDIVRRARTWNDGAARQQLLKFFEAFGTAHPITVSARKRLSSILFS